MAYGISTSVTTSAILASITGLTSSNSYNYSWYLNGEWKYSNTQSQHTLKEYEQAMKNSLADAKKFYNQIDQSTAISKFDINGDLTYVNEKFCKMTKYTKEDLIGQNQKILRSGYHDEKFYREMWKTILSGKIWTGNLKNKAKDGSYFWEKKIIIPDENSENEIIGFLAIQIDIQDLMEKNSKDWV